ncbi:hypothetical protein CEXT_415561 [Caerostris extrusa]|uniref:Uncharacterized protein n=1 Tax=Caerostris extrusa TaxID=172846 RepID=A0AAV4N6I0_CAEEX|nr:hypothetical protein CEXT_415561 [Caerostris extrusa]
MPICTEDLPQKTILEKTARIETDLQYGHNNVSSPPPYSREDSTSILNDRRRNSGCNRRLWKVGDEKRLLLP